jgi:hypothetical protein
MMREVFGFLAAVVVVMILFLTIMVSFVAVAEYGTYNTMVEQYSEETIQLNFWTGCEVEVDDYFVDCSDFAEIRLGVFEGD